MLASVVLDQTQFARLNRNLRSVSFREEKIFISSFAELEKFIQFDNMNKIQFKLGPNSIGTLRISVYSSLDKNESLQLLAYTARTIGLGLKFVLQFLSLPISGFTFEIRFVVFVRVTDDEGFHFGMYGK